MVLRERRPRLILGPMFPVMLCITLPLIAVLPWIFYFTLFLPSLKSTPFLVVYPLVAVCALWGLLATACTDPGLVERVTADAPEGWVWSDQVDSYRPRTAMYCPESNAIIEGYDHVCCWTGTAIGARNWNAFTCFACGGVLLMVSTAVLMSGG